MFLINPHFPQVLSDDNKRSTYDNFGTTDFSGAAGKQSLWWHIYNHLVSQYVSFFHFD